MSLWDFRARIVNVVDADTVDAVIDIGFRLTTEQRLRLLGINTPELHAKDAVTRLAAQQATAAVLLWVDTLEGEWPVILHTEKSDAFGRWLATITPRAGGPSLNQYLLNSGFAVPFR